MNNNLEQDIDENTDLSKVVKYKMPEYYTWNNMKQRCYKEDGPAYSYYGGRGIKVADEWIEDFWAFYFHIGKRPSDEYSLDRINNDGNYEPGNVRWATRSEQTRNQRIRTDNITGFKGINKRKEGNYNIRIHIGKKELYLGSTSELEVAEKILKAAQRVANYYDELKEQL